MRPTNSTELAAGEMVEQKRFVGHEADHLLDLEPCSGIARPSRRMVPDVGGARPISILMVVVIAAPVGAPGNRKKLPCATVRLSPSTGRLLPIGLF